MIYITLYKSLLFLDLFYLFSPFDILLSKVDKSVLISLKLIYKIKTDNHFIQIKYFKIQELKFII